MKPLLFGAALLIVVAVSVLYTFESAAARGVALEPNDGATVRLGSQVYVEHCASCHGQNLEGHTNWKERDEDGLLRAPPHDETGHTWHHDSDLLFRLTKYGPAQVIGDPNYASNMPAYENILTDREIIAVLSYIKSTWPRHIRARHDEMEKTQ